MYNYVSRAIIGSLVTCKLEKKSEVRVSIPSEENLSNEW